MLAGEATCICVGCVVDAVHALLAPPRRLRRIAAAARGRPCGLCGRSALASLVRLRRHDGTICAPCVALATRTFLDRADGPPPRIPRGHAGELRRGAATLAREYPDLAIALAPRPWWDE